MRRCLDCKFLKPDASFPELHEVGGRGRPPMRSKADRLREWSGRCLHCRTVGSALPGGQRPGTFADRQSDPLEPSEEDAELIRLAREERAMWWGRVVETAAGSSAEGDYHAEWCDVHAGGDCDCGSGSVWIPPKEEEW